jgi:hypothetical protein
LDGFRETVGAEFAVIDLSKGPAELDSRTRVVVTFGGKAAVGRYPENATLIYCMAPGTHLSDRDPDHQPIRVHMLPHPGAVVAGIQAIQPSATRVVVLWSSAGMESYLQQLRREADATGLSILLEHVRSGDLPSTLRGMIQEKPDALWLPPDPLLINPESFAVLKGFTWSNRIPFYAPSDGLVERGAAASVSCDFREVGRAAGRAARMVLSGRPTAAEVFPERVTKSFNLSAAAACGLSIPPAIHRSADRIYQ